MKDFLSAVLEIVIDIIVNSWDVYLLLAPLFLLGLSIAGVLYILISQAAVLRMMGQESLKSVATAAAFGVPLPICSCGVIPITATLRKKGASRSACMSFLITTPETGMDSIFVTWGLMGPVMAFLRPVAAFFSALVAGICAIAFIRDDPERDELKGEFEEHDHGHEHEHDHGFDDDEAVVGIRGLWQSICAACVAFGYKSIRWLRLNNWNRPLLKPEDLESIDGAPKSDAVPLRVVGKRMFTFAFIEMADDIVFALVVGVLLSGVVVTVVPDDLAEHGFSGPLMYLFMLAIGVPLYMCASASTPIAAALVAKGVSPGAALVFLMTGPATNTATIIVLLKQFGARFVSIYLGSIVFGAIVSGVALDLTLMAIGWEIAINLDGTTSGFIGFLEWTGAIALTALIIWRFWKGAAKAGYNDMVVNIRSFITRISGIDGTSILSQFLSIKSRFVFIGVPIILVVYLATGFTAVPPGHLGYGKLFGEVRRLNLEPGLHYAPPWPIGTIDVLPHTINHRILVGISTVDSPLENVDIGGAVSQGKEAKPAAAQWHSSSAIASQKNPRLAEFLTGDEGLLQILISIHFSIADPYNFFYRNADSFEAIVHTVQSTAREFIAANGLTKLLTSKRREIEHFLSEDLSEHLGALYLDDPNGPDSTHASADAAEFARRFGEIAHEGDGIGIQITSINVVDVHPTPETIAAFRDVTNAHQEKEAAVLKAERKFTLLVPRAAGNATLEIHRANAIAEGRTRKAEAEKNAFIAKAQSVARAPSVLQDLMWYETSERAYNGRQLFVLPDETDPQTLTLWHRTGIASGQHNNNETKQSEHE